MIGVHSQAGVGKVRSGNSFIYRCTFFNSRTLGGGQDDMLITLSQHRLGAVEVRLTYTSFGPDSAGLCT